MKPKSRSVKTNRRAERELPVRVTVLRPPPGVLFRVQCGKGELAAPSAESSAAISFDLTLRAADTRADGKPNFLGSFAQGPADGRFLYVNSGTRAGQAGSCWDRRAKVPLGAIGWDLIEQVLASPGSVLEGRIQGTLGDGGPVCASVKLLADGWRVVASGAPR
jgi:hypothetical protein